LCPSVILSFFNLTTIAYQETEEKGSFKVVAVVNHNLAATAMTELKDKKACFPEYAGLGKDPISFCVHLKPLICYQFYLQFKYGVKV
jgi:hypothetical protein